MTDERCLFSIESNSSPRKSSATGVDQTSIPSSGGAPGIVFTRTADAASNSFGHDGSSSKPPMSRRNTAPGSVADVETRPCSKDHNVLVPGHVDFRGAYGRRKTADFGYPGARIKPQGTHRACKPLKDPGRWTPRACGHFSYMADTESREEAFKRLCRQCSTKSSPPKSQPVKQQQTRRRAATELSSSSSLRSSWKVDDAHYRSPRRRQHHYEYSSTDRCGDTFATNLGYIIDAILEEHTGTLQGVIQNIQASQPGLTELRRVSADLVQRCQIACVNNDPYQIPCRPSCTNRGDCQPICKPVQQVCEQQPPSPYVLPAVAEKLNVGAPGQLAPNLNDHELTLRESVKTLPDLVNLVNSAADDLGLDLDKRPTAKDDDAFRNAPVQDVFTTPVVSQYSLSEVTKEIIRENTQPAEPAEPAEDVWLAQTRRNLSELSEAQSQLMDELDEITEDLGILELESKLEDMEKRSDYKLDFESIQEPPGKAYAVYISPQRSYMEPFIRLKDSVVDLERLLRLQSVQLTSSDYDEGNPPAPVERLDTSEIVELKLPVERMAEQVPDESESESETSTKQRTLTRRSTRSPLLKPSITSQTSAEQYHSLSSSSEL